MSDQKWQIAMRESLPNHARAVQPARWSLLSPDGHDQAAGTDLALRQGENIAPSGMTVIGFIDKYSFTRDCITISLQTAGTDLCVVPHASCADVLNSNRKYDLFLIRSHGGDGGFESSELATAEFKSITALGPVVVLSEIEQAEFISATFERGARGYIPIKSTPVGLVIEIIRLVKAGGTFVPLSGLPLRDARIAEEPARMSASRELTPRERAVLLLLKQGKANKTIAHELELSESTVKAHVRRIMKKMKARNRTEAVCYAYTTHTTTKVVSEIS
jgi:DNA-binding NarL/FixJ family response regulator